MELKTICVICNSQFIQIVPQKTHARKTCSKKCNSQLHRKKAINQWSTTSKRDRLIEGINRSWTILRKNKCKETTTIKWEDPLFREKTTRSLKKSKANQKFKYKQKLHTIQQWKDPIKRKALIQGISQYWQKHPEKKEEQRIRAKAHMHKLWQTNAINITYSSKPEKELRNLFQFFFPNDNWTHGGPVKLKNGTLFSRDLYSNKLRISIEYDGFLHF